MYSQNEKDELLNELKEMESLQIDMDNEGKILQEDIIDFLLNGNGYEASEILKIWETELNCIFMNLNCFAENR